MIDIKDMRPLALRKMNAFISECKKEGLPVRVTEAFRTHTRQQELYNQGRTTPGPRVTNAPPGTSMHEYGIAWDICFEGLHPYVGNWAKVASIATALGIENGDSGYVDTPHHQVRCGYTDHQIITGQVDWKKWA